MIDYRQVESVHAFRYLGSLTMGNSCDRKVELGNGSTALGRLTGNWNKTDVERLLRFANNTRVLSALLFGSMTRSIGEQ